jgi:hypothetical protein
VDSQKPSRDEALLMSVAESVGSTLGVLAAKANAFQKAITPGIKQRKRTAKRTVKRMAARTKSAMKRAATKRKPANRKRARRARRKS